MFTKPLTLEERKELLSLLDRSLAVRAFVNPLITDLRVDVINLIEYSQLSGQALDGGFGGREKLEFMREWVPRFEEMGEKIKNALK